MALQGSGQIKASEIASELGCSLSNLSLNSMSTGAGKGAPHGMAEFYGYSSVITADILIVAGGGGGMYAGGGAGGVLRISNCVLDPNSSYPIVVGGGASGHNFNNNDYNVSALNGSNSSFNSCTSIGGGGSSGTTYPGNGGSGAGWGLRNAMGTASYSDPSSYGSEAEYYASQGFGGAGTPGQGNRGGANIYGDNGRQTNSGGGGGAGGAGAHATLDKAGNGGGGISWCNGLAYAGGGGGSWRNSSAKSWWNCNSKAGTGGSGVGGTGFDSGCPNSCRNAASNRGGGGGAWTDKPEVGFTSTTNSAGNGGSGVIIIRYPGTSARFSGGSISTSGGYVYHQFNGSGTLS